MDQNPGVIVAIIGVATDVAAPVYEQDGLVSLRCNALCKHATGKTGANNQPVEHAHALRRNGNTFLVERARWI